MIGRVMMRMAAAGTILCLATGALAAGDPPYQGKLLRLSEILGSVHFLRGLCGEQGTAWRDQMAAIIAAEKPDAERQASLTAAFNHGYRAFESVYSRCTPQAIEAINRYTKEGETLADDIAVQYGN